MEPGAYSIVGSAMMQQRRLEIISNNLAQVNTVGYKSETPVFRTLITEGDAATPPNHRDGVQRMEWQLTHTNYSQAPLRTTNNPLDLAINGSGFFVLQTPRGPYYTRAGNFTLNSSGEITSKEGWKLLSKGGTPIRLDGASITSGNITINGEGTVQVEGVPVGQINIVDFQKPYRLERKGSAAFTPLDLNDIPVQSTTAQVVQGSLEMSNVEAVTQMISLIETARLYEIYQKTLQAFDETDDRAINDLGRSRPVN